MSDAFLRVSDNSHSLPPELRGGVVAIGNFDGVHRGHRAVLGRAIEEASRQRCPALVLTFDPHPRTVFRPDQPLFILTPPPMKARLFQALGFSVVVEQRFSREFASLSAEEFVAGVLSDRLGVRHAVTGFDFHFGKAREGGPAFLMQSGQRHGFDVTLVDAFRDESTDVVSSSRIRQLLAEGDLAEANGLLGYRYTVEAVVERGRQLGRTLGFPTANMRLPASNALRYGIYSVRLRRADGELLDGVASFGRRPTIEEDGVPLLETHLFEFNGDLYGETCQVSLFAFLRGEERFASLDALKGQIEIDANEARAALAGARPLSDLDRRLAFADGG